MSGFANHGAIDATRKRDDAAFQWFYQVDQFLSSNFNFHRIILLFEKFIY